MFEGMKARRYHGHCEAIFAAAVEAVSPAQFVPPHLPPPPERGRLVLLAAGKAAGSMIAAAEAHYLHVHGFPRERLTGLAITRHGYEAQTELVEVVGAGHPLPDEASLAATERMLALADALGEDDLAVFLLSGGASANLVAPAGSVTLAEKQAVTRALLRSGAPIDSINAVRKHASRIKGGRLAARIAPARLLTIALSDVPNDDLSAIGSGPTVPDPTTREDALRVIARYGIELPTSVRAALDDPANESLKPGDPVFDRASAIIAARPLDAFDAACVHAVELGYRVVSLGAELEGEARAVAHQHAAFVERESGHGHKVALISGGELTVTIRGGGQGGPNQEYALALALELAGRPGVYALAADTDGTDGGGGRADDPAGAFVDPGTLARAAARGVDAKASLDRNDSTRFFAAAEGLFVPGPTLTNANDLRIILITG